VTWGDYASGPQVQRYIETYATAFGLRRAIQFNTRVVRATQVPHGWKLEFDVQGQRSVKDFDYLVVATGLYSGLNGTIPTIPGLNDKFQGKVLHSTDFDNAQLAQNQRVVVKGAASRPSTVPLKRPAPVHPPSLCCNGPLIGQPRAKLLASFPSNTSF